MGPLPDKILALAQKSPGLTDREITDSLIGIGAPQQHINQTCRRLESQGRLYRQPRQDGKIGNYPTDPVPAGHGVPARSTGSGGSKGLKVPSEVLCWSGEIQLDLATVTRSVPHRAGVYQILQSTAYQRYEGTTRVLKIGKSLKDLCSELLNHFQRHTVANRLNRIRRRQNISLTLIFAETDSEAASQHEQFLLRSFEDTHWDLPVLNSQRGYERGADAHYCQSKGTIAV